MLRALLPLTLALLLPDPASTRGGIPWEADWAAARDRARTENRVVFLAVNMDGERANDRLAKEVYREKAVVALAERTVPLVASAFAHGRGVCPRFGGLRCAEHQQVDIRARDEVLQPDADGFVVAPHQRRTLLWERRPAVAERVGVAMGNILSGCADRARAPPVAPTPRI